jgi:hypothetical protein
MRTISALIIAFAIICAPLIWIFVPRLFLATDAFDGPAVDSGARIEIEMMRGQVEALQQKVGSLEIQIASATAGSTRIQLDGETDELVRSGPNGIIDVYAQVVQVADRRNLNNGLEVGGSSYLAQKLGLPRNDLGDTCQPMTNSNLLDNLVVQEVGPIKVRLLKPAADSLQRVFENVFETDPDLYARISSAGSLCVRRIRGSADRVSTHAFGLAVDLNIDGFLDTLGDGRTQLGLTILADFFNEEGWVWGAAFGREDSMHFEVSRQKLDEWLGDGTL